MRECMNDIINLLKAKINCIWIDTYEEYEVVRDFIEMINSAPFTNTPAIRLHTWSHTEGLKKIALVAAEEQEQADKSVTVEKIFSIIEDKQNNGRKEEMNIFIFKDFHLINDTHIVKRLLRDVKEKPVKSYCPIVVVSPIVNIPIEHEKLFTVVHYDPLKKSEILDQVENISARLVKAAKSGKNYKVPTQEEKERIANACIGLTYNEIFDVLTLSIIEHQELSLKAVMEKKIQLVEKSGVLSYKIPKLRFEDIGGNKAFKEWIDEVEAAMSDEAQDFGCKKPKGFMALGIPGCGKTAFAEAIANRFGVPLLMLDMSKIFDKLVGQTEKKIDQALRVAKACAPCILLIDEAEKALAGTRSSNAADAGTTARMFSRILEFLNDDENNVFVIMTSNDVTQLPPELTRSGRLDAMWYFGLPTLEERVEIFRIHLKSTGKEVSDELIHDCALKANNFTGAEIKEAVKSAMRKAYKRYLVDKNNALTKEDLYAAIKETIPLYHSSREKLELLESWVRGRARYTNNLIDIEGFNTSRDDEINLILD